MSYSANIIKDSERIQYYCVLKPRIKITSFELVSGSIYKTDFTYGYVSAYENDGVSYSQAASAAAVDSTNRWYFDQDAQELYVYTNSGYQVATFELYFSTEETTWHRVPTDDTSAVVFWSGLIKSPPEVRYAAQAKSFGFFPIEATRLEINNDKSMNEFLYSASFNRAELVLWQRLGREETENIEKVMTSLTSDFSMNDQEITFEVLDNSYLLDKPFLLDEFGSNLSTRPDPNYVGKPIRKLWGFVEGVRAMGLDYEADTPGTSDNRNFIICDEAAVISNGSSVVNVGAGGDALFFSDDDQAQKYVVGAKIWIDYTAAADQYDVEVTDVSSGRIDISPNYTSNPAGATIRQYFVQEIFLIQGDNIYRLINGRDYTTANFNDYAGFVLNTSAESNVGASTFNPETDYLICNCFGKGTMPTVGGDDFYEVLDGSSNITGRPYFHGLAILYDILKSEVGLSESQIDTASFIAADAVCDWPLGISVPQTIDDEIPTYKEVVNQILKSMLCRLYINADGQFSISPIGAAATPAATIESDEKFNVQHDYSYRDISAVRIKWGKADSGIVTSLAGDKSDILDGTATTNFAIIENDFLYNSDEESDEHLYLHKGINKIEFETLVCNFPSPESLPTGYATQIKQIYGERDGLTRVTSKRSLWENNLNDTLTLKSESLPGYAYSIGTERSSDMVIVELQKTKDNVEVVLDDQKYIVDNPGDW